MQTNFGCCLIDGKLEDKKKKKSTKNYLSDESGV
jgi:hypothetical protein